VSFHNCWSFSIWRANFPVIDLEYNHEITITTISLLLIDAFLGTDLYSEIFKEFLAVSRPTQGKIVAPRQSETLLLC
jgi:hypothetical protein